MMNHTGSLTLGLGLFFAVPAMTFGGGLPDSVETALDETLHALEVLGQLEEQLDAGKPLPAEADISVTEAALGDERLLGLRDEVAQLQAKVDRKKIESGIPISLPDANPHDPHTPSTEAGDPAAPLSTAGVSPGLSETFVRALGSGQVGPEAPTRTGQTSSSQSRPASQPAPATGARGQHDAESTAARSHAGASPEGKGYSANPMRQAQACFRAKRYEQGLAILEAAEPSAEVDYWTARFFERLDRIDEAIALYTAIETNDQATLWHEAAKRDREFAEWRRDFTKKAGLETKQEEQK